MKTFKEFARQYALFLLWGLTVSLAIGLAVSGVAYLCLGSVDTAIQMGLTGTGIALIVCASLGIPVISFVIILNYF